MKEVMKKANEGTKTTRRISVSKYLFFQRNRYAMPLPNLPLEIHIKIFQTLLGIHQRKTASTYLLLNKHFHNLLYTDFHHTIIITRDTGTALLLRLMQCPNENARLIQAVQTIVFAQVPEGVSPFTGPAREKLNLPSLQRIVFENEFMTE